MPSPLENAGKMTIEQYLSLETIVPNGFELDTMIVVGPYPAPGFFVKDPKGGKNQKDQKDSLAALRTARKARIILVADDGVPSERLMDIAGTCKQFFKGGITILRACESRLVHFKAYFIRWRHKSRDKTRTMLLLGSANASLQGFGENSESFIEIDVDGLGTQNAQRTVLAYFEKIEKFAGKPSKALEIKPTWFWMNNAKSSWVSMPALALTRSDHGDPASFDAWLMRGRIFHKFKPDQTFGKFRITLAKKPPKTALDKAVESAGFTVVGNRSTIAIKYVVGAPDVEEHESEESAARPRWLSQLFLETRYGFWTSEACFAEHKDCFVSGGFAERRELLKRIEKSTNPEIKKWVANILASLRKLRADIGDGADAYFCGRANFEKWLEDVAKRAEDKILADKRRACESEFRDRFARGYENFKVPSLGDEAEEFAESFCGNVLYWWGAPQATNWFSREAGKSVGTKRQSELERKSLLAHLRTVWKSKGADKLRRFHDGWREGG